MSVVLIGGSAVCRPTGPHVDVFLGKKLNPKSLLLGKLAACMAAPAISV